MIDMNYKVWAKIPNPANKLYRPTKEDYAMAEGDEVTTQKLYDMEDAIIAAGVNHSALVSMPEF